MSFPEAHTVRTLSGLSFYRFRWLRFALTNSFLCLLLGIVLPLGEPLSPLFSFQVTTCRS